MVPELALTEYSYFYFQTIKCKLPLMLLIYQAHVRLLFGNVAHFFILGSINTEGCLRRTLYAIYTNLVLCTPVARGQ